jgi:hypothetical protein
VCSYVSGDTHTNRALFALGVNLVFSVGMMYVCTCMYAPNVCIYIYHGFSLVLHTYRICRRIWVSSGDPHLLWGGRTRMRFGEPSAEPRRSNLEINFFFPAPSSCLLERTNKLSRHHLSYLFVPASPRPRVPASAAAKPIHPSRVVRNGEG